MGRLKSNFTMVTFMKDKISLTQALININEKRKKKTQHMFLDLKSRSRHIL
jgi:hypothetical protein